jgi:aminoglycoside phosphotransferase (APT) family kinase protein
LNLVSDPSRLDLPADLRDWVEASARGSLLSATRHLAGASRSAWNLEVDGAEGRCALFLLRDKGDGGGSSKDAAVLKALGATPLPVPRVVGVSEELAAVLLERVQGRSDFPAVDHESEREPTARHLMELTGVLHCLDPERLSIPHLEVPSTAQDCASWSLLQSRNALRALGQAADPFFDFALDWLEANIPSEVSRYSLVHSDMGPGNFLYSGGAVTGIIDWEVAHFGDPMEDLAAISVRDMATPVGSLAQRLREYEQSCGIPVDLERVHYYRALVLVRNSLMIGLGLAHPAEGFDVPQMTMYQTLLMRAAALVLCDNLGAERPAVQSSVSRLGSEPLDRSVFDEHEAREIRELLGGTVPETGREPREIDAVLRSALAAREQTAAWRICVACYFAQRMHRLAFRRQKLMGPLYGRLPQSLE